MIFYQVALGQPFLEGRHMERFQAQLDRVRSRLDALRSVDSAFQVFGAASHHYHLGAPMTEAEIQAFENRHTIVLETPPSRASAKRWSAQPRPVRRELFGRILARTGLEPADSEPGALLSLLD